MKVITEDLGTKTRPKLGETGKLVNRVASSIDKLIEHKLEIFAQTVHVNMPEFKKKNKEELKKSLEHIKNHIIKM